jgi:hypothetical protein
MSRRFAVTGSARLGPLYEINPKGEIISDNKFIEFCESLYSQSKIVLYKMLG